MFIIRNDVTGRTWAAGSAEARIYAIGGFLDTGYSVFRVGGYTHCVLACEI